MQARRPGGVRRTEGVSAPLIVANGISGITGRYAMEPQAVAAMARVSQEGTSANCVRMQDLCFGHSDPSSLRRRPDRRSAPRARWAV